MIKDNKEPVKVSIISKIFTLLLLLIFLSVVSFVIAFVFGSLIYSDDNMAAGYYIFYIPFIAIRSTVIAIILAFILSFLVNVVNKILTQYIDRIKNKTVLKVAVLLLGFTNKLIELENRPIKYLRWYFISIFIIGAIFTSILYIYLRYLLYILCFT